MKIISIWCGEAWGSAYLITQIAQSVSDLFLVKATNFDSNKNQELFNIIILSGLILCVKNRVRLFT